MTQQKHHILIVEDSESILLVLRDYLISKFEISVASSFLDAQKLIETYHKTNKNLDFLITDIHLIDGFGFDLMNICKQYYSNIKIALITSYNINEYMNLIYQYDITHVLSKHSSISLKFIEVMLHKVLTKDILGIQKYFPDITLSFPNDDHHLAPELQNRVLYDVTIKSPNMRYDWSDTISKLLSKHTSSPETFFKLIIDEISINAMIRAPKNKDGSYKFQTRIESDDTLIPNENIVLSTEDYFLIRYGCYDDWIIIICQDFYGGLSKHEILYRLSRHIVTDSSTGLPEGLPDSHGRGFFLLREHLTHLIVNIHKGQKSEIICLYNTKQNLPYKDIAIFEIE